MSAAKVNGPILPKGGTKQNISEQLQQYMLLQGRLMYVNVI